MFVLNVARRVIDVNAALLNITASGYVSDCKSPSAHINRSWINYKALLNVHVLFSICMGTVLYKTLLVQDLNL